MFTAIYIVYHDWKATYYFLINVYSSSIIDWINDIILLLIHIWNYLIILKTRYHVLDYSYSYYSLMFMDDDHES